MTTPERETSPETGIAARPAPDSEIVRPRRLGRTLGVLVVVALLLFALPLLWAMRGDNSPLSLSLLTPAEGANLTGQVEVRFTVTDERNLSEPVEVSFYYTTDPLPYCPSCPEPAWSRLGATSALEGEGSYLWDTAALPDGDNYSLKAVARAGGESTEALVGPMTLFNGEG